MQDYEGLSDKILKTLMSWATTFVIAFFVIYITNNEAFKSWFRSNTIEISGLKQVE